MVFWESGALDKKLNIFERGHPVVYRQIYNILVPSKHNTCKDHMLLQFGYTWRHDSAVKQPSSGQHRVILLK